MSELKNMILVQPGYRADPHRPGLEDLLRLLYAAVSLWDYQKF